MAEPKRKKQKTGNPDRIFIEFLKDQEKVQTLHKAYMSLLNGLSMMNICILEVRETNARLSEGFTRASCATSVYHVGNTKKTFEMGRIFMIGLAVLEEFTKENNPRIPVDEMQHKALAKLLHFMYDDHSALLEMKVNCREGEWALALAQHLLSPLAVGEGYTIENYHELHTHQEICPCKEGDKLIGKAGDTSFGCKRGWHGKADILMNDILPVECTGISDQDLSECLSVASSTEVKSADRFHEKEIQQLIAQTIVFSFLQNKHNAEKMRNSLVPGIGISAKNVMAYFYDCQEDILLATAPIKLEANSELSIFPVVFLWLTLNYKIFCSGITDEMKKMKANFFKRVDDCLDIYRNEVMIPCHKKHGEEPKNEEQDYTWAIDPPKAAKYLCVNTEDYGEFTILS